MEIDRKGQFLVVDYESETSPTSGELMQMAQGMEQQYRTVEEDQDIEMQIAWDDVFGAELDLREVKRQGRRRYNTYER